MVTQTTLRTREGMQVYSENNFKFSTCVDHNKHMQAAYIKHLFHATLAECGLISELACNIREPCETLDSANQRLVGGSQMFPGSHLWSRYFSLSGPRVPKSNLFVFS